MRKTSSAAKNRYNKSAYDQFLTVVPKGRKQEIAVYAETLGVSTNGLVNQLLRQAMGMSLEEWKRKPEEGE